MTSGPKPLQKWRISNFADLEGRGGLMVSGRWHSKGHPVVYLSDSPAGALLETLVHLELDPDELPDSYQLLQVEVPEAGSIELIELGFLPEDWASRLELTQDIGDEWLEGERTLLLEVPSAITPYTNNYLLNPMHPDTQDVKLDAQRFAFDKRIFKLR